VAGRDEIMRDCFRAVAGLMSGARIDEGDDGSVWLMPDCAAGPPPSMWMSHESFQLGSEQVGSVFDVARVCGRGDRSAWSRLAAANRWMEQAQGCSSLEELAVRLACMG